MFSTCSELTRRAPIPDGRMAQFMQPWCHLNYICKDHLEAEDHMHLSEAIWESFRCCRNWGAMKVRFSKWIESYKPLLLHISMTFIVISFKKIVTNNQTLKLADFTCNLGFGHSKLPKSRVPLCSLIWYEAKILGPKESIGFKNLVYCTPGNTKNHTRILINILYPTQCHEFHLIWCDISKSHCEEDPSNYAGLEKRNNCRRWKRFFVPLINFFFTWLCRYGYFLFCILCLTYQRSAKS